MATKATEAAVTPAADPARIRNVALVGHAGAGKTTLAEALLAATGAISRMGSVTDGTTVCDNDSAEQKQQRSVTLSVAPFVHEGVTVNLLDTPGYADFVGELRAGLRAADAALFVVSAVDGVDAATIALWEECAAVEMPRAVVVTRLDHPRADFEESVAICQRVFGEGVQPLYLPVHDSGEGEPVVALIGLLSQRIFDHSGGGPVPAVRDPEPEHAELIDNARSALIEGIIAESEDETLMDRYLEGEELDVATLIDDLETAVARGSFHPVLGVCATTGVGIAAVLEVLIGAFPSPLEHPPPAVTSPDGQPHEALLCDPAGPLVAEVVKTTVDPYVGRVSLVRVFSGTLRPDTAVHVSGHGLAERGHDDHDVDERLAHLMSPLGATLRPMSHCIAGDICALTKLTSAETGDTISAKDHPLLMAPWDMPEPLLPVAVSARTRSDEDAMAKGLTRLTAGDPTLRLQRNPETHQLILWCMGEAHADVVLDKLRTQGVELDVVPVQVALRETFATSAEGLGRHVKQSGGHGQFAVCKINVEPLPRGEGFEFVDKIVGGAIPGAFVGSVEKGVRTQMARGLTGSFPVVDLRVTLLDGKAHSVDSSDAAFQTAGALALREAAKATRTQLLEPVHEVAIMVPDEHVGSIMSDLSGRRGHVTGTESVQGERTVVRAEVPESALMRYAIDLRAMTAGTGRFNRTFLRYEPMPEHEAKTALAGAAS
ncbi:MAG: elongation factor G-like protein EF-G2 [Geodermatophilaceae bacterium]|nr:elongation factor G-like protein EF-G2 [Geodermatophilaceae bacterium]MDQ3455300.1 elongation factor G-like protein EF-G2 [Actinomycetota bacterium]